MALQGVSGGFQVENNVSTANSKRYFVVGDEPQFRHSCPQPYRERLGVGSHG
jgi:hypothetical protein